MSGGDSPNARESANQEILRILKKRQQTPSVIAKKNEIKPEFKKSQYNYKY